MTSFADGIPSNIAPARFVVAFVVFGFQALFVSVEADASLTEGKDQDVTDDNVCHTCETKDADEESPTQLRVLVVVGILMAILIALFLCYLRVRCMTKRARARRRSNRQGTTQRNTCNTSSRSAVFAMNVPPETMNQLISAFAANFRPHGPNIPLGEIVVQPPPYSEQDPIASPAPQYEEVVPPERMMMEELPPPPPYSPPEKDERNEEVAGNSSVEVNACRQEGTNNGTQEGLSGSGEETGNSGANEQ